MTEELLEGAYVQAWVWVSIEDLISPGVKVPSGPAPGADGAGHSLNADECGPYCRDQGDHVLDIFDDEIVRDKARELYTDEGEIEIDDAAKISRAHEREEVKADGTD